MKLHPGWLSSFPTRSYRSAAWKRQTVRLEILMEASAREKCNPLGLKKVVEQSRLSAADCRDPWTPQLSTMYSESSNKRYMGIGIATKNFGLYQLIIWSIGDGLDQRTVYLSPADCRDPWTQLSHALANSLI